MIVAVPAGCTRGLSPRAQGAYMSFMTEGTQARMCAPTHPQPEVRTIVNPAIVRIADGADCFGIDNPSFEGGKGPIWKLMRLGERCDLEPSMHRCGVRASALGLNTGPRINHFSNWRKGGTATLKWDGNEPFAGWNSNERLRTSQDVAMASSPPTGGGGSPPSLLLWTAPTSLLNSTAASIPLTPNALCVDTGTDGMLSWTLRATGGSQKRGTIQSGSRATASARRRRPHRRRPRAIRSP